MQNRYDLYIRFPNSQTEKDAPVLAKELTEQAFEKYGVMGVANAKYHESKTVLTATVYLSVDYIFSTRTEPPLKEQITSKLIDIFNDTHDLNNVELERVE